MNNDKLYELAFKYKKTKLWNILWDTDLFAVKLSDGRIGYISIMGAAAEHCALGLYIGDEGFNSLRSIIETSEIDFDSFEYREVFIQQSCIQCAFVNKAELSERERREVKDYTARNNIRLSGKNANPKFLKYIPNCFPWHIETDEDADLLCEALSAAVELSALLKDKKPSMLGINSIDEETKEIAMLVPQDGGYIFDKTRVPQKKPIKYPAPEFYNDIAAAKLNKAKRQGVWECEIIRFPEPIQDKPDEIPRFPVILFAVEISTGCGIPIVPVSRYEENPQKMLDLFVDAVLQQESCPVEIRVRDCRTYEFARSFCKRLNIVLKKVSELPALEEMEDDFWRHFGTVDKDDLDSVIEMLEDLFDLDEDEIEDMPEAVVEQIRTAAEEGLLPDELTRKINKLFHFNDDERGYISEDSNIISFAAGKPPELSYVISVSLGTGCYRHIKISGGASLEELHRAILSAFDFDDDHAYAFFMDNKLWSKNDCYYIKGMYEDVPDTAGCTLSQAELYKDKRFKYLFDFGDEWVFQCKVLRVLQDKTEAARVISKKGKAPKQYR